MTNPGQSTPWAQLPIPSEGKVPDIPVDLASIADPLDTLLKNVIGGATAPTAPLSPTLVDASASIDSLNTTQTTQQSQITTLQNQVAAMNVPPWVANTERSTTFSINGLTSNYLVHSLAVPSSTSKTLIFTGASVNMRWTDGVTSAVIMGALQIKRDGETAYGDRARALQTGVYQTLSTWHLETLPAGVGCSIGLALTCVGAASSSATAAPAYMWPHIFAIQLPWGNGPDLPTVGPTPNLSP